MSAWIIPGARLSLSALQDRAGGQLGRTQRQWTLRQPVQLKAGRAGWLQAGAAPVWVTLHRQPEDWVLQPGERLPLLRGQRAVIGPWRDGTEVALHWQPARQGGPATLKRIVAAGLSAVAEGLAAGACGIEALARRARHNAGP